ncbi:hypothetical protein GcM3_018013 [Golovinomyces cichoracearum]|uniref:Uncharacterized protein n=1 Tax=Golovinomyces cichoracearum TaxID=62708 RepID=A0A420J883_9PEZI|nr:hypothetical protein GcM3_018013 [Golovinomyces cichoracearum]
MRQPKNHRAPPSLEAVSMLENSPVFVITESIAIAAYLLKTNDTSNHLETFDKLLDEIVMSFVSSTLGTIISVEIFLELAHGYFPWPMR